MNACSAFGPVIGVTDASATIFWLNEADRLGNRLPMKPGLDQSVWRSECFEKGVLTTKDHRRPGTHLGLIMPLV